MNLLNGEIIEIYVQDFTTCAKVRVGNAFMRVPLMVLPDARVGDVVLISSGVAISKVVGETPADSVTGEDAVPTPVPETII